MDVVETSVGDYLQPPEGPESERSAFVQTVQMGGSLKSDTLLLRLTLYSSSCSYCILYIVVVYLVEYIMSK